MIRFFEEKHSYPAGTLYCCTVVKGCGVVAKRYGATREGAKRRAMYFAMCEKREVTGVKFK